LLPAFVFASFEWRLAKLLDYAPIPAKLWFLSTFSLIVLIFIVSHLQSPKYSQQKYNFLFFVLPCFLRFW